MVSDHNTCNDPLEPPTYVPHQPAAISIGNTLWNLWLKKDPNCPTKTIWWYMNNPPTGKYGTPMYMMDGIYGQHQITTNHRVHIQKQEHSGLQRQSNYFPTTEVYHILHQKRKQ